MNIPTKFNKIKYNNFINSNKLYIYPVSVPMYININLGVINMPKYPISVTHATIRNQQFDYAYAHIAIYGKQQQQIYGFAYSLKNNSYSYYPLIYSQSILNEYKQYFNFISHIPFQYPLSFNSKFPDPYVEQTTVEIYDENFKLINSFNDNNHDGVVDIYLQNGPKIIYIKGNQSY